MRYANFDIFGEKLNTVKSVLRATNILICLSKDINTVTGIANYCKLSKTTAQRLLRTLTEVHLATQDNYTRRYYMGHLINQLASNQQSANQSLILGSLEDMEHLFKIFNETVTLCILVGLQQITLHDIASNYELKVMEKDSVKIISFWGATSRALLSQLQDTDLHLIMKYINLSRQIEVTITNKQKLITLVKQARKNGYSISVNEIVNGAMGISVPIKGYIYPAALTILGPTNRLKPKADLMIEKLKSSANHISNKFSETVTKRRGN